VIGGSGYFDGSGDFLGIPYSANLTMPADFTAECWVYVTSAPEAYGGILAFSNDSEGVGWNILIGGTTTKFHFNVAMTYTDTATSITLNAWTHLALVRSGSTGKLYINGVADANTVTTSATATCPTNPQIGRYPLMSDRNFFGYISNTRVIKGTAVYTSNFTPPSGPVLSNSNTQLLLNYTNGAIIDNAMMTDLETVGDAQISTSVKKYGTGSMSFDGTGDWVRSFDNLPIAFGSGDFTVEGWIYTTNLKAGGQRIFSTSGGVPGFNGTTGIHVLCQINDAAGSIGFQLSTNTATPAGVGAAPGSITANSWIHLAFVYNSSITTGRIFVNGALAASAVLSGVARPTTNPQMSIATIPGEAGSATTNFQGYMDDFQLTKGVAKYSMSFSPPLKQYPNS